MTDPRREVLKAAQSLHRDGMNVGTAGNLSLREGEGMLITPSGRNYLEMESQDIVFVGADGQVEGAVKPSSEWRFHLEIYQNFEDAGAIVHTHSTHATALACLNLDIPAFHYEVAFAGGSDIRCASYATFGTSELAHNIVTALKERSACLIGHHGLVCYGSGLRAALALAQKIEQLSQIYLQCLSVGEPEILDDKEMAKVVEKFRNYSG